MRVFVYFVGKPKDAHMNALAAEYVQRTMRYARCEMREIHPERFDPWERHPAALKVLLDPAGKLLATEAFVALIARAEQEGRDHVYVLGGHDGLPAAWRPRGDLLLSLTPLTLPHELARVVLTEQIYRAFTTLRGHPYPR